MTDHATCASCGKTRDLCRSVRIGGVTQPRLCNECLLRNLGGDAPTIDEYWITQLVELGDAASLAILQKQSEDAQ